MYSCGTGAGPEVEGWRKGWVDQAKGGTTNPTPGPSSQVQQRAAPGKLVSRPAALFCPVGRHQQSTSCLGTAQLAECICRAAGRTGARKLPHRVRAAAGGLCWPGCTVEAMPWRLACSKPAEAHLECSRGHAVELGRDPHPAGAPLVIRRHAGDARAPAGASGGRPLRRAAVPLGTGACSTLAAPGCRLQRENEDGSALQLCRSTVFGRGIQERVGPPIAVQAFQDVVACKHSKNCKNRRRTQDTYFSAPLEGLCKAGALRIVVRSLWSTLECHGAGRGEPQLNLLATWVPWTEWCTIKRLAIMSTLRTRQ